MPEPESISPHPRFTCPTCGAEPVSVAQRVDELDVTQALCCCVYEHAWIVRWLAVR